ncbi:preprotein translocase [Sphingomonas paeninsulae]|uniref:Preprotein translocase n=1 Tax=Sphingomonas paeninsulae TaxID=2319844 RepID=A0A494TEL4_SPHPE|nr:nuclease-related domain-containing protein [Sphingomonas paeninsulae]AYJ87967.1 preprotein translocase [Sphingomonas paeninsulae]
MPEMSIEARSENEIFSDLEQLCRSDGYVHALAYFSWRDNFISYDPDGMTSDDMIKSYKPSRLLRTEIALLIGLMVKCPIDTKLPTPDIMQGFINDTERLLQELHDAFSKSFMARMTLENIEAGNSPFTNADVLREPIFYGGESAYSFQYRDFSGPRYSKDNDWLTKNRGFSIQQAQAVIQAVNSLQDRKMQENFKGFRRSAIDTWTFLPGLTFCVSEIVSELEISEDIVRSVLSAFSLDAVPTNIAYTSVGDFNLINAFPLIPQPHDSFMSLNHYALVESLYESPFYWLIADTKYRSIASDHRGLFAEEMVAERLRKVFGAESVFTNVNILQGKDRVSEIDVLVTFADRAIIFQCKSKKLNLESRRGNDILLQSDFKKAVQDAYDQGLKCAKGLDDSQSVFEIGDHQNVKFGKFKKIYICTVLSEHYPALSFQSRQFLKFEQSDVIQPPLVCDVFFIDVATEMLSTPLRFLSYIDQRANYLEKVSSVNEITILGYHPKKNLWFDDDMNMVMITDDFGVDIDVAMMVRREGIEGVATPPGILTKFQNLTIGRIIRSIESAPQPALVDLGFALLTLGEDTLKDLTNGIDQIAKTARMDSKLHDISMGFNDGKTGITVHCSKLPNAEAADRLRGHCRLRKYILKADSWFGLAVRFDDGMPKFGLKLDDPWQPDEKYDRLTREMSKTSNAEFVGGRAKHVKIGRNDLCPCGSGKKFKKCCLN